MLTKRTIALSLAGLTALVVVGVPAVRVFADQFQEQINEINNDSVVKREKIGGLDVEAASLQETIDKLAAEVANLQTQIGATEKRRDDTMAQIAKAEADLAQQRQFLSDSLKAMYVDGDISPVEMLASSQDINHFVDKEEYQRAVQGQVQRTLDSIKQLKIKLDADKTTLERMIADLNDMRAKAAAQQAEQARLLAMNQSQKDDLDGQIKNNNSKVVELRKQQALENARLGGGKIPPAVPGGGGYPGKWAFAPIDSIVDSWGMYNRECVSWTAYKVYASGRYMPYWGGVGNANQWDDNARAAGIPVDRSPRSGDVAVSNSGYYGHVMYVEAVGADGSIYVSDYNQQFDGLYREYWVSASNVANKGLVFIHF